MKVGFVTNCASLSWNDWETHMPLWPSMRRVFPSVQTSLREWRRTIVGAPNTSKIVRWGCFCPPSARLRHTLLDRELSLPRHWLEDRPRWKEAGIVFRRAVSDEV